MANKYGTIITAVGAEIIAKSILTGTALVISEAAAGDGGGAYYEPSIAQSALVNERWRGEITSAQLNSETPNMLDVKIVIPDNVGGFVVRELGLFNENGDLIAVCNTPDTEKVAITGGVSGKLTMLMHIVVADASVVDFVIKPSLGAVTQEELSDAISHHSEDENAHPELQEKIKETGDFVSQHNEDKEAHPGMRELISNLGERTSDLEKAEESRSVTLYASLEEIGLTAGAETIDAITQALGENSELFYATGDSNAKIYPGVYGIAHVVCVDADHIRFQWTDRATGIDYVGVYCAANTTKWIGWLKVGSDITLNSLGAVAKAGDTMIGKLYAGEQSPGEYLVRNQKLAPAEDEESPTVDGEICWWFE